LSPTFDGVDLGHVNDVGWAPSDEAASNAMATAEKAGRHVMATFY
jgi:hypothetical protein